MQRSLLLALAVGLTPVALSYGAAPQTSLPWLFGIDAGGVPTRHVFRAIMGLYLALICFWALGALRPTLRLPALWSLFVFTFGLAVGRLLSLILDGWPGPLLFAYVPAEFGLAASAAWLMAKDGERQAVS
ncbi:MAG: DUF4345 domain-containing protein [Pseudomonadota bacterium]